MGFFEDVVNAARGCRDASVARLVLGWHASLVVASDGRWGIGCVPNPLKEAHTAREVHTNLLLEGSMTQLAELIVSPFPQEFAAATAACAALLPFPGKGFRMDAIMPCAHGDKVAVLGYGRELISMMRDWGWNLAVFDDNRRGPDCFPQKDFAEGAQRADWVWLSPEAIRDRWLISTADVLKTKKGCFLQGPGLPWLRDGFASLGVTHLVVPAVTGDAETIRARISAGGDPWLCPGLEWRVHAAGRTDAIAN
ncbi:MAG: hypothetical protein LBP21_03455 [Synergistaceae bacterium]|nr:hypothetical protein [Synergistaceae bacterium]